MGVLPPIYSLIPVNLPLQLNHTLSINVIIFQLKSLLDIPRALKERASADNGVKTRNNRLPEADDRDVESGDRGNISIRNLPKLVWAEWRCSAMNLVDRYGHVGHTGRATDVYGKEVTSVYAQPVETLALHQRWSTQRNTKSISGHDEFYPAARITYSAPVNLGQWASAIS